MVSVNFCSSCEKIVENLTYSKAFEYNGEVKYQPCDSDSHQPTADSQKCTGCDGVISPEVLSVKTCSEDNYELIDLASDSDNDPLDSNDAKCVSSESDEILGVSYGELNPTSSSDLDTTLSMFKTDQPDPLAMKYFRLTLASQKRFSDKNNSMLLDLTSTYANGQTNSVIDECASSDIDSTVTITTTFARESSEKMDHDLNCWTSLYEIEKHEQNETAIDKISTSISSKDVQDTVTVDTKLIFKSELEKDSTDNFGRSISPPIQDKLISPSITCDAQCLLEGTEFPSESSVGESEVSQKNDETKRGIELSSTFSTAETTVDCKQRIDNNINSFGDLKIDQKDDENKEENDYINILIEPQCQAILLDDPNFWENLADDLGFDLNDNIAFSHNSMLSGDFEMSELISSDLITSSLDVIDSQIQLENGLTLVNNLSTKTSTGNTNAAFSTKNDEPLPDEEGISLTTVNADKNDDGMDKQVSSSTCADRKRTRNRKRQGKIEWIHPVYTCDTNVEVDRNQTVSKIKSSYIIDTTNNKKSFICQIDHDCCKYFTSLFAVEYHLFGHFFFVPCPHCRTNFKSYRVMDKHLRKCRKNKTSITKCKRSANLSNSMNLPEEREAKKRKISSFCQSDSHDNAYKILKSMIGADSISTSQLETQTLAQSEAAIQSQFNTVLQNTFELEKLSGGENSSDTCKKEYEEKVQDQKIRKHSKGSRVYRCPFCEYKCKPGGRKNVMIHLNGGLIKGKNKPPNCQVRRKMKPADPITGLYERLEPILITSESSCKSKSMRLLSDEANAEDSISSTKNQDATICQRDNAELCNESIESGKILLRIRPSTESEYQCAYCGLKWKLGQEREMMRHLNSFNKRGTIIPPICRNRRELKPADPETGLYEKVEPILIEPVKFKIVNHSLVE